MIIFTKDNGKWIFIFLLSPLRVYTSAYATKGDMAGSHKNMNLINIPPPNKSVPPRKKYLKLIEVPGTFIRKSKVLILWE